MVLLSKIVSYIFAIAIIFIIGNLIFSIVTNPNNIPEGDWVLVFCLLMIMLMGIYYIANDVKIIKNKGKERLSSDEGILDDELVRKELEV